MCSSNEKTYRKTNQWSSHPRDMIESIRRFYSNSFVDAQRQEAINLFLGNYTITKGQPTLWELTTDYYLHHIDPRFARGKPPRYPQPVFVLSVVTSNGGTPKILKTSPQHRPCQVDSMPSRMRKHIISSKKKCGRNTIVHSPSPRFRKSSPTT